MHRLISGIFDMQKFMSDTNKTGLILFVYYPWYLTQAVASTVHWMYWNSRTLFFFLKRHYCYVKVTSLCSVSSQCIQELKGFFKKKNKNAELNGEQEK